MDLAVQSVSYSKGDAKNGADITLSNLQKMAMPCTLEVIFKDGSKQDLQLPVETWFQSYTYTYTIHLHTTQSVESVIIDPENKLPDSNRMNNKLKLSF